MIIEKVDPNSGAILFKKDEESLALDRAIEKIAELEKRIEELEKKLNNE